MSNTPSETVTPENDDDDQDTGTEKPRKTGIIPDAASFQHLQALEDAIDFRAGQLAQSCPDCGPDGEDSMCDVHAGDLRQIGRYQRTASTLAASMTAARERARQSAHGGNPRRRHDHRAQARPTAAERPGDTIASSEDRQQGPPGD